MEFEGIYTPIVTPFAADGSIDFDAYGQVIDWQIENGVHGVIVGGSTGEFYALSKGERIEQFRFAKERIGGRALFMAGTNELRVDACLEITAAAGDAGAEALLVAAPPYSLPSELELAAHVLEIERIAQLPIMLYNYPGRTGVNMGAEFLERVAENPSVCAIKESSGDVNRIHLLDGQFPQIQLCVGAEDQVLEFYAWGAKAWVCASANIFPRECVRFHEICAMGSDFATGRRIMRALLPLMHVLEQGGSFLQCIKYGCELQERPGGIVRPPLRPMPEALQHEMDAIMRTTRESLETILASAV
jgi:4-hydroxy-tetrahydrodipicolinate synthase